MPGQWRLARARLRLLAAALSIVAGCEAGDQAVVGTVLPDVRYAFNLPPDCGAWCYRDEAHNLAARASETDDSGFAVFGAGQLVDGRRGVDAWDADLGFGPAYEWVGWIDGAPVLTLDLGQRRAIRRLRIGMSNRGQGGVTQPSVVRVAVGDDLDSFDADRMFARGDGSLAEVPPGSRGDVTLPLGAVTARYVRIAFVRTGWLLIDEVEVQ